MTCQREKLIWQQGDETTVIDPPRSEYPATADDIFDPRQLSKRRLFPLNKITTYSGPPNSPSSNPGGERAVPTFYYCTWAHGEQHKEKERKKKKEVLK